MTQSVVVQVGQCGNQVGSRFWDLALREHASVNKKGIYDEALSSFFRNVDTRRSDEDNNDISGGKIRSLKARAVLIDMEEGVVNEILQGPLRDVFDSKQLITDVSGSGNNWAVGHKVYGSTYRDEIVENLRKAAEHCDCLQCFFVIHSMGGGTGSGLGTSVLNVLEDEFPEVCRIVTSVYPSAEDDVITSPYNSVLAMRELTEHADCVLPIENQSLVDIVNKIKHMSHSGKLGAEIKQSSTIISGQGGIKGQEKPFDAMNNIVANMLLNLTSSARFEGSLNMDLNEITMNLVPFPRLHYLVSSLSPLYTLADVNVPSRRLDQMFSDAFSKDHQLIHADPKHNLYLACALIVRGDVQVSDLRRNIERMHPIAWMSSVRVRAIPLPTVDGSSQGQSTIGRVACKLPRAALSSEIALRWLHGGPAVYKRSSRLMAHASEDSVLKPSLPFVSWNQEGWKTGLCSVPPVGHSHSLLALANNTCVKSTFIELKDRFMKLYKKKAHLHHYLHVDGMEQSCFTEAVSSLSSLIEEYNQLDATKGLLMTDAQRLNIAV
ncbi:TBE protein, partial [Polyodon spathula]|nr:TBE protein [Polyodon spathula]